nr:hypothetical protein BaRGS_014493 [Batillaria attramentaria]
MKLSISGLLVAASVLHMTHGYGLGPGAIASPIFHAPALFAHKNHLAYAFHKLPVFHGVVPGFPKMIPFPFQLSFGFPGAFAGSGQRRLGSFVVPGRGRTIFSNVGEKDFDDDFFDFDDDFFDFDDDYNDFYDDFFGDD